MGVKCLMCGLEDALTRKSMALEAKLHFSPYEDASFPDTPHLQHQSILHASYEQISRGNKSIVRHSVLCVYIVDAQSDSNDNLHKTTQI